MAQRAGGVRRGRRKLNSCHLPSPLRHPVEERSGGAPDFQHPARWQRRQRIDAEPEETMRPAAHAPCAGHAALFFRVCERGTGSGISRAPRDPSGLVRLVCRRVIELDRRRRRPRIRPHEAASAAPDDRELAGQAVQPIPPRHYRLVLRRAAERAANGFALNARRQGGYDIAGHHAPIIHASAAATWSLPPGL
jgi:hypothetical protein